MHTRRILHPALSALVAAGILLGAGCSDGIGGRNQSDGIPFEPQRPVVDAPLPTVTPYSGDNIHVQEAQERFSNGMEIHRKIVWRTCTPNGGVCHNQKEYPDLHTPANFLAAIGAPCNVQPGEDTSVYDGCEQTGDRFRFQDQTFNEIEIGKIQYIPGEADYGDGDPPTETSPGLHITLHDPVPTDRTDFFDGGQFIRTFVNDGNVEELSYATLRTRWFVIGEGKHVVGQVRNFQISEVNELLAVGVVQGDLNGNGVFGARESKPLSMIAPGKPEESYLIARLRGTIYGDPVPGSRMPLANQPLTIAEMLALFCFVEQLPDPSQQVIDLDAPVDYSECSYAVAPEELNLLGEGVTWDKRVRKILEANCGGCHGGVNPDADFDVLSEGTYSRLLENSVQNPELKFIEPGDPERSYLWLKINASEDIVGQPMPIDPLQGVRRLTEAELGDIQTWIVNGAIEDQ